MSLKQSAIICFLFICLSVVFYAWRYNFNFSAFVAAPKHLYDCVPEKFKYIDHFQSGGSDGGYNYLVAQDPLHLRNDEAPKCFYESVAYTYERFLYHFFSWAIVFGHIDFLQYGMVLINIFAIFLICYFNYKISILFGFSNLTLVAMTLLPGIWQPLRFSTVDLLWMSMILGSIYFYEIKKPLGLTIFLSMAMLSRNLSIAFILVFFIDQVLSIKKIKPSFKMVASLIFPLIFYYGFFKKWQTLHTPTTSVIFNGEDYFTWPLSTFLNQASILLINHNWSSLLLASIGFIFFLSMLSIAIFIIFKKKRLYYEAVVVCGFTAMIFCLNNVAWGNSLIQISRVLLPCFTCFLLLVNKTYPRHLKTTAICFLFLSLFGLLWFVCSSKQILVSSLQQ
ncbi:MAG: hypothetical protein ACOYOK_04305 [Pseudobdellovibrionaceae bacterium]